MVDVLEEKIQRGNTLGEATFDLAPLLVRDDARKQIIGKYALRALVVAVDGERNPLMQKREVGGLLALAQFFGRKFQQSLEKISKVIGDVLATAPPDIDTPSNGDLWSMLKTGRAIRKLGKKDMYRLLRWGPMAVADLVSEYFETELLRAVVAARGIFGSFLGPWSAGSSCRLIGTLKKRANPEFNPTAQLLREHPGSPARQDRAR